MVLLRVLRTQAPYLICPNQGLILHALILYSEKNIVYVDAYNALNLRDAGIEKLYSYDTHYDRIDWLRRSEP